MKPALKTLVLPVLSALMVSGCSLLGPDYQQPVLDNPAGWRIDVSEAQELSNTLWWKQFDDPALDALIDEALQNNKDLLIAAARVDEFLGRYGVTRADLFPQVGADGAAARDRFSEDISPVGPGISNPDNIYQAFLTATWEIDLWGRLRRPRTTPRRRWAIRRPRRARRRQRAPRRAPPARSRFRPNCGSTTCRCSGRTTAFTSSPNRRCSPGSKLSRRSWRETLSTPIGL